jgi:hypothetical protein
MGEPIPQKIRGALVAACQMERIAASCRIAGRPEPSGRYPVCTGRALVYPDRFRVGRGIGCAIPLRSYCLVVRLVRERSEDGGNVVGQVRLNRESVSRAQTRITPEPFNGFAIFPRVCRSSDG